MKRFFVFAFAIAGIAHTAGAQGSSPSSLDPLKFLAGHCWVGTFADGKTTDEHCYKWVYGSQFIADHHVVASSPAYEGDAIYGWNAAKKSVEFHYWSNGGVWMDGIASRDGNTITFSGQYSTPTGVVETRTIWTLVGDDMYRAEQNEKTPAGWKPVFTVEYRRKR